MAEGGGRSIRQADAERERKPSPEAWVAGSYSSERCSNLPKVTPQGRTEQGPMTFCAWADLFYLPSSFPES